VNRIVIVIFLVALLVGCASPGNTATLAGWDWKYSEVLLAIDTFKKEDPATGAKLPHSVRSIYIKGEGALSVYLADSARSQGAAGELSLKKLPSGSWGVVNSRFFEY